MKKQPEIVLNALDYTDKIIFLLVVVKMDGMIMEVETVNVNLYIYIKLRFFITIFIFIRM